MTFASAAIPPTVAILGATGAVGQELLTLLEERSFPLKQLRLLASPRSAGQTVEFKGQSLTVEPVSAEALSGVDVVLASAGGSVSRQWAPVAVEQGAVVIDNSSAFRMDPAVPLVVPEVNPQAALTHQGIIANPNCTTILLTLALAPLAALRPLRRVVVSTYQSASGAGARAMGADAPGDDLDRHVGQAQAVLRFVGGLESFAHGIDVTAGRRVGGEMHRDLVLLSGIAHVRAVNEADNVCGRARGFQRGGGFRDHTGVGLTGGFPVDPAGCTAGKVEPDRSHEGAECRQHAGKRWVDHGG